MKSNIDDIKNTQYSVQDSLGKFKNSIERRMVRHVISKNIKNASKKLGEKINPEDEQQNQIRTQQYSVTEVSLIDIK